MKLISTQINLIKLIVSSILPGAKVLLFGSYAREDNDKHSDYDLLVITKETFSLREKMTYRSNINKSLVDAIHKPVDVLLNSEAEINKKKDLPGHIIRTALKEGIVI